MNIDNFIAEKFQIYLNVAESLADYKAGRFYGPFDSHEDLAASLKREVKKFKQNRLHDIKIHPK